MLLIHVVFSQFLTLESKKNLIQKRKKEKLPVDIVPSSEPTLDKCEQVAAVEMDLSPTETADTEAPFPPPAKAVNSTQGLCTWCHKLLLETGQKLGLGKTFSMKGARPCSPMK